MPDGAVRCAGVILAGGRSSRMGGGYKALAQLGGCTLLERVIGRLEDQAEPLWVSVDTPVGEFARFGPELIPDRVPSHRGPLAGLYSALWRLTEERDGPAWLLLCPCDAPFLPGDLATRLLDGARYARRPAAVVRYQGHRQPTFSVWHRDALEAVQAELLEAGRGGLMRLLDDVAHAPVDWPEQEPPPFFNINTPGELEQAKAWL